MKRLLSFIVVFSVASLPFAQSLKSMKSFSDSLNGASTTNSNIAPNLSSNTNTKVSTAPNIGSDLLKAGSPRNVGTNNGTPPVPEPASMIALGTGVAALISRRRRNKA